MAKFGIRKGTLTTATGRKDTVYFILKDGKRIGYSNTKKGAEDRKRREQSKTW